MLWLHIGLFKTGSSAIQGYLHANRQAVCDMGLFYAVRGRQHIEVSNRISSGNGVALARFLLAAPDAQTEPLEDLLSFLLSREHPHALISSELMAEARPARLTALREALASRQQVRVLVFVRNVYEHAVSMWHQLIKRHGYTKSLVEFCRTYTNPQIRALRTYAEVFGDEALTVVHYDSVAGDLIPSFFRAMGLAPPRPPAPEVVNRSLNAAEVEVLAACNAIHGRRSELGARLSDHLIYAHPDRPKSAPIDAEALALVTRRCAEGVEWANVRFFDGRPVLSAAPALAPTAAAAVDKEVVWRDVFEAMRTLIRAREAEIRRLGAADLAHRARMRLRGGDAAGALTFATQALEIDPENEPAAALARKAHAGAARPGAGAALSEDDREAAAPVDRRLLAGGQAPGLEPIGRGGQHGEAAARREQAWRDAFRAAIAVLEEREAEARRLNALDTLNRAQARMRAGRPAAAQSFSAQAAALDPANAAAGAMLGARSDIVSPPPAGPE